MSNIINVDKMHSLDSDFVFVVLNSCDNHSFSTKFIQLICLRRLDIGCDQFFPYKRIKQNISNMFFL